MNEHYSPSTYTGTHDKKSFLDTVRGRFAVAALATSIIGGCIYKAIPEGSASLIPKQVTMQEREQLILQDPLAIDKSIDGVAHKCVYERRIKHCVPLEEIAR